MGKIKNQNFKNGFSFGKNELFVLSIWKLTVGRGTVLSDARPLHPKEDVIPLHQYFKDLIPSRPLVRILVPTAVQ
jgi:hypothetical protein